MESLKWLFSGPKYSEVCEDSATLYDLYSGDGSNWGLSDAMTESISESSVLLLCVNVLYR